MAKTWASVLAVVFLAFGASVVTASPAYAAQTDIPASCRVPTVGATRCAPDFDLAPGESVSIYVKSSKMAQVGFCLYRVSDPGATSKLGGCRAASENGFTNFLWTNPGPSSALVYLKPNVDNGLNAGSTLVKYTIQVR
jgi:hypothetical protein